MTQTSESQPGGRTRIERYDPTAIEPRWQARWDDLGLYKAGLAKNKEGFSPDGLFSMQGAQNVYQVLHAFVPEVQKAKVDLAATFDNRFAERALAKYRKP